MYFSRMQILPNITVDKLPSQFGSVYEQHKSLWRLFGDTPERRRDFLYRHQQVANGRPCFYAVSEREPTDPDQIWKLEVKDYTPKIKVGDIFEFDLRVNPTVDRSEKSSHKRHDVIMDRKYKIGWKDLEQDKRPPLADVIYAAGEEWLQKRSMSNGFEILDNSLQIDGYATFKFFKRGAHPVTISTLDYKGLLRVNDADKVMQILKRGIGRAKGFGCGLLMIKRV